MRVAERLGSFAAGLRRQDVPEAALAVARDCIVDTVGVVLAGVPEPATRMLVDLVREEGGNPLATAIGQGFRCSPSQAALVNGTAGHALDYDDVHLTQRGHPSVVIIPAVLAAAEHTGATGAETLLAYVAGIEVIINLARGIGKSHYLSGWHSTSTLGTIGAAAACARLYRCTPEQAAAAVSVAASMASGLRRNFGTDTKPLHPGHAARCGLQAAQLAARGFSANSGALDARFGFLDLYTEDGNAEAMTARLGKEWALISPGMSLKKFPCCYATHHSAAAALLLKSEHDITLEQVELAEVLVPPGATTPLIYDRPVTGLQAKFSMPYVIASALSDGQLTVKSFTDEWVNRPHIQQALHRVVKREADGPSVGGEDPRWSQVTVILKDGRRCHQRMEHPPGSPGHPMSAVEVDAKFRDCAQIALSPAVTEQALARLRAIDLQSDLRELMTLLSGETK